jgi:hypothetical protein
MLGYRSSPFMSEEGSKTEGTEDEGLHVLL